MSVKIIISFLFQGAAALSFYSPSNSSDSQRLRSPDTFSNSNSMLPEAGIHTLNIVIFVVNIYVLC
jgi:hypothetical protein